MYISSVHLSDADNSPQAATIHEFYKDSFSVLYQTSVVDHTNPPDIEWMLIPMKKTLSDISNPAAPEYFFDVRMTEDFSSPAPQYLLLHGLGLKHTAPLCIKGMDFVSLIMAFQVAELYLKEKETALFSVIEQYNHYDNHQDTRGYCASFAVSMTAGEFQIEKYGICHSKEEIRAVLNKEKFHDILVEEQSEKSSQHFLIRMFELLRRKSNFAEYKAVFAGSANGCFGYLIISKGA